MATNIFQTLRDRVLKSDGLLPLERRAMWWFQSYSKALKQWQYKERNTTFNILQQQEISKKLVNRAQAKPGFFYFFLYNPANPGALPYYDEFPFVLVLDRQPASFLALNFHYLDYFYRAKFFDVLWPLRNNRDAAGVTDLKVQMRVTYDLLLTTTKYKMFRPCLKRYLVQQVKSPLLQVGMSEWDLALFLPVEQFVKEPQQVVWGESKQKF